MVKTIPETPPQHKSTPPKWQFEGPFSDLTFTFASTVVVLESGSLTQDFENPEYGEE